MFPKIKKEIGKFFLSEEGSISKKNIIKIGVILVGASLANVTRVLGHTNCDERNHCNISCEEVYDAPESGLIRVGNELGINFTAGTEHANMGFPVDNVCHVRLVSNSGSDWINPANDNSHVNEYDNAWYNHDNSGGKRQKWYDIRRNCISGLLDNQITVQEENQRIIKINHSNSIEMDSKEMVAKDICGSQHDSVT
ncbi:MAG: hypothetical protein KAQ83_03590 [Nanoarchaeota archaeon]|nr:hypothetical protein [Nanoarchaeota archaeon]